MTAKGIINQTAHLEQLLKELAHRTCKMGEQVESLTKQITAHLAALNHRLDKERHQSRKFIPFYDREKFYQLNEHYLTQFNISLLKLSTETGSFQELLACYQATLGEINAGVSNGR